MARDGEKSGDQRSRGCKLGKLTEYEGRRKVSMVGMFVDDGYYGFAGRIAAAVVVVKLL